MLDRPKFRELPRLMLIALVKYDEEYPTRGGMPDEMAQYLTPVALAVKAGLVEEEILRSKTYSDYLDGDITATYNGIELGIFQAAAGILRKRGWATFFRNEVYGIADWYPTPEGVDQAHLFLMPWWRKCLPGIQDVKTIVVALITAAITAVVTASVVGLFQ